MYTKTVAELMTGVTSIDFVQPWYRCVPNNMRNTGMALGGIGSAITATPAGSTPCFHFFNGCAIANEDPRSIELGNYFYGESLSDDLTLRIRSMDFFQQDAVAYPLIDARGTRYFRGDENQEQSVAILGRIVGTKSFVDDNYDSLVRWGLIDAERSGTLHLPRQGEDFRYRNLAFLLNIFMFSVSRNVGYTRSLIGDVLRPRRLNTRCYPADMMLHEFEYPLSNTHYRDPNQRCSVTKSHHTTLCPGNDRLCSLPAYVTDFVVENTTREGVDVTFVLSVENFIGYDLVKTRTGEQDAQLSLQRSFRNQRAKTFAETLGSQSVHGLMFHQDENSPKGDIRGELCLAVATEKADGALVTSKASYFLDSESNVVDCGIAAGKIDDATDDCVSPSGKEPVCGALCVSLRIPPGQTRTFGVVTVLDFPDIRIGERTAQKKYTTFYPRTAARSRAIASEVIANRKRHEISDWVFRESMRHEQVLEAGIIDARVAASLRQLLVDHISFLAESSVWDSNDRFLVRECVDYPFFNSLDVYFYGSFGLLKLLPGIDNRIVRGFAESVLQQDPRPKLFGPFVRFRRAGVDPDLWGVRKVMGSTPHDIGTPFDAGANAYSWKNVASWADLAPKFVMLVYRNFLVTRDRTLLKECWPAVVAALDYVRAMLIGEEGYLPISAGYSSTFDNLRGDGICIYPASLWIAGLHAAEAIATLLGEQSRAASYADAAARGRAQLIAGLWDAQAGVYLYSVAPIRREHIDEKMFAQMRDNNRLLRLLEVIGHEHPGPIEVATLLRAINAFVDDDHAKVRRECLAGTGRSMGADDSRALENLLSLPKIERRRLKKRLVHACAAEIFVSGFEATALASESDHVFANQLCADTYLYYLDLPQITSREDKVRVLNNIVAQNIRGVPRRVGAANLVARGGADLDAHQAQEVWIGIQYSLAGALLSVGMIGEFEKLITDLFDAIYAKAKIPFGIPEAFNCTGTLVATDLAKVGIDDAGVRAQVIGRLQRAGVLSPGGRVDFAAIEDAARFSRAWDAADNELAAHVRGEELHELLLATGLKYTAGRYFRAGMVHILPEILRKHSNSVDLQPDVESCLALLRTAKAAAPLRST